MTDQALIETTRKWVDAADRVVALTVAGIPTDSGLPDLRGPQDVLPLSRENYQRQYLRAGRTTVAFSTIECFVFSEDPW